MLVLHAPLPSPEIEAAARRAGARHVVVIGPDGEGTPDLPEGLRTASVVRAQGLDDVRSAWQRSLTVAPAVLRASESAQDFIDQRVGGLSPHGLLTIKSNDAYWYHLRVFCALAEQTWRAIEHVGANHVTALSGSAERFFAGERPAFDFLLRKEEWGTYLIASVARRLGRDFRALRRGPPLPELRSYLRTSSILSAKAAIVAGRIAREAPRARALETTLRRIGARPWALVLLRGASEWYSVKPVVERLREEGKLTPVLVVDDILRSKSAATALQRAGEEFLPLHAFARAPMLREVAASVASSARAVRALREWTPPAVPDNPDVDRLVLEDAKVMRATLAAQLHAAGEQTLFKAELASLFSISRPEVVLSPCMVEPWGWVLRAACDEHEVPLLAMQNAVLTRHNLPRLVYAHRFAVGGSFVVDWMTRCGAPPEAVILTGLPMLDRGPEIRGQYAERRRRLDMSLDDFVIVVTTQAFSRQARERNEALIELAASSCQGRDGFRLLVKPHPREEAGSYIAFVRMLSTKLGIDGTVTDLVDVYDALGVADVLFTRSSTTILSALAMGCPVAVLEDDETDAIEADYLHSSAVQRVRTESDLRACCQALREDPAFRDRMEQARNEYLRTSLGTVDGQATQRVLTEVYQLGGLAS